METAYIQLAVMYRRNPIPSLRPLALQHLIISTRLASYTDNPLPSSPVTAPIAAPISFYRGLSSPPFTSFPKRSQFKWLRELPTVFLSPRTSTL